MNLTWKIQQRRKLFHSCFCSMFVINMSLDIFLLRHSNTTIIGNMSSEKLSRPIDADRNIHWYIKNSLFDFCSWDILLRKYPSTSLVTRSYIESLLSSSFVIWIDEQKKANKITNTVWHTCIKMRKEIYDRRKR